MEIITVCKTCSIEFLNKGKSTYCPKCAIERSKQQQKEYFERKKKNRNKGIMEDLKICLDNGRCLSDRTSVDTLLKIQKDIKIHKKGYMKLEDILEKYKKLNVDLLKKYIKRCLEDQ